MESENKNCQNCKQDFNIDSNELSFYEKINVPIPNVCPGCRFLVRALWRNETTLYSRKCDKTDKPIVSMYNPKLPYKVVSHEYYNSDKWDPYEYGVDFDETRPFFEQFSELLLKVPKMATFLSSGDGPNINSVYSNYSGGLKNSYFVFNSGPVEEVMYARGCRRSRYAMDIYYASDVENVYESINCHKSSNIFFGVDVSDSFECYFVNNLRNSNNCFGCVNLRNASYCIFNKQVSKEEYFKTLQEVFGSYKKIEDFKKKFLDFKKKFPVKENHNLKTINSTGDYLTECKNVSDSFEVYKAEDCYQIFASKEIKDSIGTIGYGFKSNNLLECVSTGYSSNIIGGASLVNCHNVMYSHFLTNCHDCIGCDSLKNAKYCILNKQYTEIEYNKIKDKIVKEITEKNLYGLMIPKELSPFAYNETIAKDNMPLIKKEALTRGFRWEDDIQKTEGKETLKSEDIPDHIKNVPDSITKEILKCISCNRNYKITEQELLFYKKMNIPIPRICFYCRHQNRINLRGFYKSYKSKCGKCQKEININSMSEINQIVYCEKCYQAEVY